jgi:UDP-N-acetylglucosamine 4,6-dehydratase
MFAGMRILVTGGTGSFGQIIVRRLLDAGAAEVHVLSRDEAKQDAMRERFADDRLRFITGDIRDASTVVTAMEDATYVFHAAALKQVPNCERHPMEAIRTNALGSENVRLAALRCRPEAVVAISTDKACSPINTMGLCKALMERLLLQETRSTVRFVAVRYGNVIGSRGSVVPLFRERIRQNRPLPVTDMDMTRFLLLLPRAVDTALEAAISGEHGELWVRKMAAATIADIVMAMAPPEYPTVIVGVRPGEKMHEVLVNEDEMRRAEDRGDHYVIGSSPSGRVGEYTSANTERLSIEALRVMLEQAEMAP